MRGKLRDKRATSKHEVFSRELIERRRSKKHPNRVAMLLEQTEDENYEIEPEEAEEVTASSSKK